VHVLTIVRAGKRFEGWKTPPLLRSVVRHRRLRDKQQPTHVDVAHVRECLEVNPISP
jgi:hypothetical protein